MLRVKVLQGLDLAEAGHTDRPVAHGTNGNAKRRWANTPANIDGQRKAQMGVSEMPNSQSPISMFSSDSSFNPWLRILPVGEAHI